ncbi:hypothetical protein [Adhaeribacter terreus]|uniref:DUF4168 domain-containing protein n=1 Tax=Adhaeribacter terreus TaxID=529703 RepID=A0ABW0EDE5_9BACT
MKKLFTLFFLGMAFAATAQSRTSEPELANNAAAISRVMAHDLQLNEQEYIQIKNLTFEKLRTMAEIQDNYAYNPRLRNLKLEETEKAYQWQVRHALNAKQVEQYLAWHESAEAVLTSVHVK